MAATDKDTRGMKVEVSSLDKESELAVSCHVREKPGLPRDVNPVGLLPHLIRSFEGNTVIMRERLTSFMTSERRAGESNIDWYARRMGDANKLFGKSPRRISPVDQLRTLIEESSTDAFKKKMKEAPTNDEALDLLFGYLCAECWIILNFFI